MWLSLDDYEKECKIGSTSEICAVKNIVIENIRNLHKHGHRVLLLMTASYIRGEINNAELTDITVIS